MKKFLKNFLSLLLMALAIACIIAFSSKELPLKNALARPVPKSAGVTRLPGVLSLPDAIQMFYNPNNLFLDIRERQHYDYEHIAGAVNIPAGEIDNLSDEEIAELKKKTHVIVYWNSGCCGVVWNAADKLMKRGLVNVRVYPDGWPQWKACRLPINTGGKGEK